MRVALIQLWFGPIPDYFQYHLETIKNINLIDFFFFTDQDLDIKQDNFHYYKIDREYVTKTLGNKLDTDIEISSNKKFVTLKRRFQIYFTFTSKIMNTLVTMILTSFLVM